MKSGTCASLFSAKNARGRPLPKTSNARLWRCSDLECRKRVGKAQIAISRVPTQRGHVPVELHHLDPFGHSTLSSARIARAGNRATSFRIDNRIIDAKQLSVGSTS